MSGVAIYMEGGGETSETKAAIRQGMGAFLSALRDSARRKRWHWKIVPCGDRIRARDAFLNARTQDPSTHAVLLVDSETAVPHAPKQHLLARDGWHLDDVLDSEIQMMVQIMETWIIADAEVLQAFYGQGFSAGALPKHADLEQVTKIDVAHSLEQATRNTQKGRYHKIRHASQLLERVRSDSTRARCAHCERLFSTVGALVA